MILSNWHFDQILWSKHVLNTKQKLCQNNTMNIIHKWNGSSSYNYFPLWCLDNTQIQSYSSYISSLFDSIFHNWYPDNEMVQLLLFNRKLIILNILDENNFRIIMNNIYSYFISDVNSTPHNWIPRD